MSSSPMRPVHALLSSLIDYAGLFPPAALGMPEAVSNYAGYRVGEHAWALGRFILPVSRLDEFNLAASEYLIHRRDVPPWRLSVLAGTNLREDLSAVASFNSIRRSVHIEAVEVKAFTAQEIAAIGDMMPHGIETFFEIPINTEVEDLVDGISRIGARAKVRTGSVAADGFPQPNELERFIRACSTSGVAFKATAGLHHAIRSCYPLTYEKNSPTAIMYGFLNLFLAAASIRQGAGVEDVIKILREDAREAFQVGEAAIVVHAHIFSVEDLLATRRDLAVSFGSCSFREPIDELHAMHLL